MREARIHVRHVRDLLKSADDGDAYQGVECASLSYLGAICQVGFQIEFELDTPLLVFDLRVTKKGDGSHCRIIGCVKMAKVHLGEKKSDSS